MNDLELTNINLETKKISVEDYNKYKYIYIFGDSHGLCFGQGDIIVSNKYYIQQLNQDSASARGLINTNSTLGYGKKIEEFIKFKKGFNNKPFNIKETLNYYVFKFGQVDSQINYYYKIIVKNEYITKDEFFKNIIDDYISFLNRFENINILVCGINMPSPLNYKKYLYNTLKLDITNKNELLNNLTIEELNNDTIIFNNLLKQICLLNNITYFDLTDQCTYINNNLLYLRPEFIGNDHHYKGCRALSVLNKYINEYNLNNNISEPIEYLNHPLYKNTYNTFISKLIKVIENNIDVVLLKEISILFLLENKDSFYIYHNNSIKYSLVFITPKIILNVTYNLINNEIDANMFIFGFKIILPLNINECKLKIKLNSNIPIKIYDGKKWLHFNVCELNEIIQINDINKWRISPSNEYINQSKMSTFQFISNIYELSIVI